MSAETVVVGLVPPLFHWSCDHSASQIIATGALVPHAHPLFPNLRPLVWLTSATDPDAHELGVDMSMSMCNKMAWRFEVTDLYGCVPWIQARASAPFGSTDDDALMMLEQDRDVSSWWVSPFPVAVTLA